MSKQNSSRSQWSPDIEFGETFGVDRSERCIEIPWAQKWIENRDRILDIGFALSDIDWLRALLSKRSAGAELTAVDIVLPERVSSRYPEDIREAALNVPIIVGDVRTASVPVAAFDAVTCVSTIEHVGFDIKGSSEQSAFDRWVTGEETPDSRDPQATVDVMAAIARSLEIGGIALVSVPMGRGGAVLVQDKLGYFTRQQEYNAESWTGIADAKGFRLLEERFFTFLGEAGWQEVSSPADLAHQTAWLTPHATGVALAALERTS